LSDSIALSDRRIAFQTGAIAAGVGWVGRYEIQPI
jgi:hypothetical protein